MAPKHDSISDISPAKENWNLIVRVVRLWYVKNTVKDKLPFSIEMVLMDSKADRIHATVRRTLIYKFNKELKEDSVFAISNFGAVSNIGSYRTTKHLYKLNFQFSTRIKLSGSRYVPQNLYLISHPAEIFSGRYDTDYLVDLMGMLTAVDVEKTYQRNGAQSKNVVIELDHDGYRFKCTLFGAYVDMLNAFLASGKTDNVVVVILLAKVKILQGRAIIQNTIYSTKLLFNPVYSAAVDLKKKMVENNDTPLPGITQLQDNSNVSLIEDFMQDRLYATIEGLKKSRDSNSLSTTMTGGTRGFFFLYGYGASLLLPGGRTAHSSLNIPIEINEKFVLNLKKQDPKAILFRKTKLIIWDEAPMMHRYCFECFDRSMRDIMSYNGVDNSHKPFGGISVVLGGDFRQILPVVRKGGRQDILAATINASNLCMHCKGMVTNEGGEIPIKIPDDILIHDNVDPLRALIDFVYPDILQNMTNAKFFQDRCILAPTLEAVEKVNDTLLSLIPGTEKEYYSSDLVCKSDKNDDITNEWFTTEFLNDIKCSGIPNHRLRLKKGCPAMLMRNIDQAAGLCNGTRVTIDDLGKNFIGATVITGKNAGEKILVPRMNLIPSDPGLPFKFMRRQYRLTLCFSMTINKSQGQSLPHVGIYLPKPVFTHGQLYVALSRVTSRKGLKLLILNEDGEVVKETVNVVYREVFANL
ncbi:ATP-dependent DNA helicase PIF1 [Trifolium repens]|nr:ATP-dependent DNA helicase PIF1 [Trifolium repens]